MIFKTIYDGWEGPATHEAAAHVASTGRYQRGVGVGALLASSSYLVCNPSPWDEGQSIKDWAFTPQLNFYGNMLTNMFMSCVS